LTVVPALGISPVSVRVSSRVDFVARANESRTEFRALPLGDGSR
jgi:hypothetical protein